MTPPGPPLRIQPVPVDVPGALLEGAARTVRHLQWGAIGALAVALALGGVAGYWRDLDSGGLDVLARVLLGPVLAIPLPLALLSGLLGVVSVAMQRRTVHRCASDFRPPAFQRYELARSPASRLGTTCLVTALIGGFVTLIMVAAAVMVAELWAWVPALIGAAVTGSAIIGFRGMRAARARAGAFWDEARARWPDVGSRPHAVSLEHRDAPLAGWGPLVGLAGFLVIATTGTLFWGLWATEAGTLRDGLLVRISGLPITPFHLAGALLPLAALLIAVLLIVAFTRRLLQYRAFTRDPALAAEERVQAGAAPSPRIAAARELLRSHPARIPAIACAVLAGTCLYIAPVEWFLSMPGDTYPGSWAPRMWAMALPGALLAAASWGLFSLGASRLARHRLRILQTVPDLDPVIARETTRDSDNTTAESIVYEDRPGDRHLLEKYSNDDPR